MTPKPVIFMQDKLPFIRVFARKYPVIIVLVSAIAVLASVGIILGAKFDTGLRRMIPDHAPKTFLYYDLIQKNGDMDKAYIVFSADRIHSYIKNIEAVGREIESSHLVTKVVWKISDEARTFLEDVHEKKAPLRLSPEGMKEFIRKLTPDGMERELDKYRIRLLLPAAQTSALTDPLNFSELFRPNLRFAEQFFDPDSGYFLTPDRKNLIMILTPAGSSRDTAFSEKFTGTMKSIISKHTSAGLTSEITGSHAISSHKASAIREIVLNAFLSIISVMLVFLYFFRSLKGLLYVMFPAVTALFMTLGITLLFSPSLSEVTGVFAGMLAGLSVDLGIVLYVRYLLSMEEGANPVGHMDRTIQTVYRGITAAALTTGITFLPLVFSSFQGIRELGILICIGMLLCWLLLFTLTSLTIKPSSRKFAEIAKLRDLAAFSVRRPFVVISATLCVSLMAFIFIPHIRFSDDIAKTGKHDSSPRKTSEHLKETFINQPGVMITEVSMEMESALVRSLEIKEALAKEFDNLYAAGDILPPMIRQQKNLLMLSSLDPERTVSTFRKIAAEKGFASAQFTPFTDSLLKMLKNREPITFRDIKPVHEALDRLLVNESDQWQVIVTGTLKKDASAGALKGYEFTGPEFIKEELYSILKKDALIICLIVLSLVNIVLWRDFRKLHLVLICQAPAVVSILCTLGIMGITGISLTFMTATVFLLLFGIGTHYAVHLLHHYHMNRDIERTLLETGTALLIAALITVAGIGSVGFSSYTGLAAMGQVAAIGTIFCVIFSLTLIPALLGLYEGRNFDSKSTIESP